MWQAMPVPRVSISDLPCPWCRIRAVKTKHYISRGIASLASIAAAIVAIGLPQAGHAQTKVSPTPERIGVYDSRAVAVAYAGSSFQKKTMMELMTRMRQAKESGNTKEVARIEAEGKAWQAALHKQGFGTAPVDDLLAHITDKLPAIRTETGVTRLVSKWNKAELEKRPAPMQVDVTMRLVDAFEPTETQRKRAVEIQQRKPEKMD